MIILTNLRGDEIRLLPMHIETVEACPDTRLQLTTGKQLYVQQSPDEVAALVIDWYRAIGDQPGCLDRQQALARPQIGKVT